MRTRTRAYWPTRILLLVGIVATMLAVWFAVLMHSAVLPMGPIPGMTPTAAVHGRRSGRRSPWLASSGWSASSGDRATSRPGGATATDHATAR